MTSRRRWFAAAVVAVVLALGAGVLVLINRGDDSGPSGPDDRIAVGDGVNLVVEVHRATNGARAPLVVLPTPFGADIDFYRPIARQLAARGYQVVSYVQRGFHDSGGDVDFAGPNTQADASKVITWALAHTDADPDAIGMLGISYGAGISLLTAANDPRVRAVAAMSTWTDFGEAFDPDQTPALAALNALLPQTKGRLDASVESLGAADAAAEQGSATGLGTAVRALAAARSPSSADINHNGPAIFIANGFADSLFAPAPLIEFYGTLTVPRHLQLAPGDHGGPEYSAVEGRRDNPTMTAAFGWLDRYLRGRTSSATPRSNSITVVDPVTGASRELAAWPTQASSAITPLGTPNSPGTLGAAGAWTSTLTAGKDSGADFGPSAFATSAQHQDPVTTVEAWDASAVVAWSGASVAQDTVLSGTPAIDLGVTSSASTATLFVYLYDVDANGQATLMCGQPWTGNNLNPGTSRDAQIDLQPLSWTVRAGHHLVLAVDTSDPRYASPTPPGTTITLSSTAGDQASVRIPVAAS